MSPRELDLDELEQAAEALSQPARYAVAIFYEGELLCTCNGTYPDRLRAEKLAAEKRRMFPRHTVRVLRGETTWTEEATAA
jgi:hypothetical protein